MTHLIERDGIGRLWDYIKSPLGSYLPHPHTKHHNGAAKFRTTRYLQQEVKNCLNRRRWF